MLCLCLFLCLLPPGLHPTTSTGFARPTLTRVQVGLLSLARELKGDLDTIAARADTGSSKGLHSLLQGECRDRAWGRTGMQWAFSSKHFQSENHSSGNSSKPSWHALSGCMGYGTFA